MEHLNPDMLKIGAIVVAVVITFFAWEFIAGMIARIVQGIGVVPVVIGAAVVMFRMVVRSGWFRIPEVRGNSLIATDVPFPPIFGQVDFWLQVALVVFILPLLVERILGKREAVALALLYVGYLIISFIFG